MEKASPEISKYAAPVHFSMQGLLVNNSVADGRISWKHKNMTELTSRIMSAAEALHSGALFCNLPWELAILNGLPESPSSPDELESFFNELYQNLSAFRRFKDLCTWKMYPAEELHRDYAAGNIMLYAGNLTMILHLMKNADFDWSGIFFQAGKQRGLPGGISSVAIMKDASSQAEAAVDFLTSPAAQALFSEHRLNMSCYLETNRLVLESMGDDEKQFLANVKKLGTNETERGKWHSIKVLEMKNIAQRVINGESSAGQAVKDAMAYVKNVYPEKISG